jgi:hypothetical protein
MEHPLSRARSLPFRRAWHATEVHVGMRGDHHRIAQLLRRCSTVLSLRGEFTSSVQNLLELNCIQRLIRIVDGYK